MNRDNRSTARRSILHEEKYWRAWPESRSQQVVKTCKMSHYSKSCGFIVILQYWSYEKFGMAFAQNWFFSCLNGNAMRDTGGSSLLLQELQSLLPLQGWLSFRLAIGFCSCLPLYTSPPADCAEDWGKQSSWDARHYSLRTMSAATDQPQADCPYLQWPRNFLMDSTLWQLNKSIWRITCST